MVIKSAKNQTPRILKSTVAMKAVEKQIAEGKTPSFSRVRRVQVTLSEELFDKVKSRADRSGVSMSGVVALIVDEHFNPPGQPKHDELDKLRAELHEYRERILSQQAEMKLKN